MQKNIIHIILPDPEHPENIIAQLTLNNDLFRQQPGELALTLPLEITPGISFVAFEAHLLKRQVTNQETLPEYSASPFFEVYERDATGLYIQLENDIIPVDRQQMFCGSQQIQKPAN